MNKGIRDHKTLVKAFHLAQAKSANGAVFVENDLRTFCNPTRQKTILKATEDLIQKLLSACPSCDLPGYWPSQHIPGLPCRACGSLTRLPKAEIWGCKKCGHEEQRAIHAPPWADPARCDFYNP
jgi:Zn ribbon nucleic-acid-binding protein